MHPLALYILLGINAILALVMLVRDQPLAAVFNLMAVGMLTKEVIDHSGVIL